MGTHLNVTEWMRGHVGFGATDYAEGEKLGKANGTTFEHEVLIEMTDIDRFVSEPKHAAPMRGQVVWLGKKLPFSGGEFNMLVDSTDERIKHMFYRIPFLDDGKPMTMLGHKELKDDKGADLFGDITTLFIHIYDKDMEGHDFTKPDRLGDDGQVRWPPGDVARGIIHISLKDGVKSALSFDAPSGTRLQKLAAVRTFVKFYGAHVFELWVAQNRKKSILFAVGVSLVMLALLLGLLSIVR